MVVIIMGEIESGGDSVGARVAESLGWEFLDLERPYRGGACGSMNQAKGPSPVELLRAVLDSSIGEWRDVVLSCPVLTEKDQKSLRDNRSLVEFVYLKANDAADATFRLNPSGKVQNCMLPSAAEVTPPPR